MPLHIPKYFMCTQPGIRAWWRRLLCRLWHGHKFNGLPTEVYCVKCQHCDNTYHLWPPPPPPPPGKTAQECPHCHNVAYGGNGKPYWCHVCHRESQEGEGRKLAIHYR